MRITNIKNVLLALRNTYGSHKASELRHNLLAAARDYKISDTIAIFMSDHASTQNTALELLIPKLNIRSRKQRLRCTGHIINLITQCHPVWHRCRLYQRCDSPRCF